MKKHLSVFSLTFLAACSSGIDLKSDDPFQMTCLLPGFKMTFTIDPELPFATVDFINSDGRKASETWKLIKASSSYLVLEGPREVAPLTRINRKTHKVTSGSIAPPKSLNCTFKRF